LCQFNIGIFDDVTLNFVVFVIVSVFYSWTGHVIVAFVGWYTRVISNSIAAPEGKKDCLLNKDKNNRMSI
jgi:hypothetical protein